MLKEKNKLVTRCRQGVDILLTIGSFLFAYYIRRDWMPLHLAPVKPFNDYLVLLLFIVPIWGVLLRYYGVYESIRVKSLFQTTWPVVKGVTVAMVVLMALFYPLKLMFVSKGFLAVFYLTNLLALVALKVCLFALVHYIRRRGYNIRTVIIVGAARRAEEFAEALAGHREWGIKVVGFVETGDETEAPENWRSPGQRNILGRVDSLKTIVTSLQVDEVVFAVPRNWLDRIEPAVLACEQVGIKASIIADFYAHKIAKMEAEEIDGWSLLVFNPVPRLGEAAVLKRVLDIAFSFTILAFVSPVFLASMMAIKLTSPGPVFFRQVRCGLNGRKFEVYKFRTMVVNAEALKSSLGGLNEMSGPVFKARKDPRITPVGRFLRKYSIDELPQFINVMKGDMSIVGPRPPIPSEVEKYDYAQRRRLSVKPGITCLWQVSGRNRIGFSEWVRLDLEYIDRWSLWLDVKIIAKTVPTILRGTGL